MKNDNVVSPKLYLLTLKENENDQKMLFTILPISTIMV